MVYRNHIHHQIILFMKKFYVLSAIAVLGFLQIASAQIHNAIFSGNWSDASIWGPSGQPSNPCTNCTITINDGVSVTLDISFSMKGNSKLLIGSNGAFASSLIITATSSANIASGHNILLSNQVGGNPTVKIVSALSSLTFTQGPGTTGKYDGVFLQNLPDLDFIKIVGISPSNIGSDGVTVKSNFPPIYGSSLPNAQHPAPFTLNSDGTLPVLLANFDAILNDKVVNLSWTTTVEINSGYFAIQRSADGSNWQSIGTVKAKGFSSTEVNYSYTDASPLNGINYYRLQIVDADGKYKYSPIKVIHGSLTKGFNVFPNPANSFVNVLVGSDITTDMTIRLINQYGQVLQEKKLIHAAGTTVTIAVSNYPQGNYILQAVGADGSKHTSKVLISR